VSILPGRQITGPVLENLGFFHGHSCIWNVDLGWGTSVTIQVM
jgi:hypothetical protein